MEFIPYCAEEAFQFCFYQIPKGLFTNEYYKGKLNSDAILLYPLLLDRLSVSRKRGWIDENGMSIKVARYAGTNKVDLLENYEFGYCSLIKATKSVIDKMTVENKRSAKITPKTRIEKTLVDSKALRKKQ